MVRMSKCLMILVSLSLIFSSLPCIGEQEISYLEYKSFEDLGGLNPSNTFLCQNDKETVNLTFILPDSWEDYWYIIHLHFYIEINNKEDYIRVDADVNSLGCVFAEFFPFTDNGTLKMRVEYFNMIQGRQEYIIENNSAVIYIANYMPTGGELPGETAEPIVVEGLRTGENMLNISLTGANGVTNLTVFENLSGIECTNVAPPDIEIDTPVISGDMEPGKTFMVTARVWNKGVFPLKDVTVYIQYPSDKLDLLGNDTEMIPEIMNETTISWRFRAKAEGDCKLVIIASASNDGSAKVEGNIPIYQRSNVLIYFVGVIIIAGIGILIYGLIKSRGTAKRQIKFRLRKRR